MKKRLFLIICTLGMVAFAFSLISCKAANDFDILIQNGKIVNGTGNPWFNGDVGIIGDTISEIGDLSGKTAAKVIDAKGLIVSPGFIDMHTHCDRGLGRESTNANLNYITQGVTTVVTGNCGSGTFKIRETKEAWEEKGIGTNAVMLTGFGAVRNDVIGVENRAPTPEELEKMRSILRQAMEEGAWGMSTGLQYIPDRYANTEEVIAMTKVVGEYDGIYTSHQRDEEEHLVEAVEETIRIGKETGVKVNAAHFKAAGKNNWGLLKEAVRLINGARAKGIYITADMYPYDKAATTPILAIFNVPKDAQYMKDIEEKLMDESTSPMERLKLFQQAADELAKALADKEKKAGIRKITIEGDPEKVNWVKTWGWHNFTIVSAKKNTHLIGKIISDLAQEQKRDAFDIIADLFIEEKNDLIISLCTMSEDDMKYAMQQDWLMISSDGSAVPFKAGSVHPRNYGSFPRILRKYVKEEKALTLEQGIRKMSSLPAHLLQMKDRGLVVEGFKADIVIFDPEKVMDNATYLEPHQYSSGMEYVLVNGKITIDNGEYNETLNGNVLLLTENK
ncbi:MAG: D-aminoacylase [Candidatus Aminicenantes bacterium]|nr:MAG: D-aminoacylase [Candidatus Aminicenantes bacterium]